MFREELAFAAAGPGLDTSSNGGGVGSKDSLKDVDQVRSVFPETWLWSNSTTG